MLIVCMLCHSFDEAMEGRCDRQGGTGSGGDRTQSIRDLPDFQKQQNAVVDRLGFAL